MDNLIGEARSIPAPGPKLTASYSPLLLAAPGREMPLELRITAPATGGDLPIILLSHGHGLSLCLPSNDGYRPLADFYAERGFVVIQPSHANSKVAGLSRNAPGTPLFWRERVGEMKLILDGLDAIETMVPAISGRRGSRIGRDRRLRREGDRRRGSGSSGDHAAYDMGVSAVRTLRRRPCLDRGARRSEGARKQPRARRRQIVGRRRMRQEWECSPQSRAARRRTGNERRVKACRTAESAGGVRTADDASADVGPATRRQGWRFRKADGTWTAAPGRSRLRLDSGEALRDAAVAGFGIAFLPDFVVAQDLAAGRLHRLLPDLDGGDAVITAIYPSRRLLEPRVRRFIDLLATGSGS